MADANTEAPVLSALLADAPGVIGAVLGSQHGELRVAIGDVQDGDTAAATTAVVTTALAGIGTLLGLGELGVASLKSASAARLFARQGSAVLTVELDGKRPIGALETKLRDAAWAPSDKPSETPGISRTATGPRQRTAGATRPPPNSGPPMSPATAATMASVLPRPTRLPTVSPNRAPSQPTALPQRAQTSPHTRPTRPPPRAAHTSPTRPPQFGGSAVAGAGTNQVFAGDLEELSLPDLLEFLRSSHRTGLLVCSTATGTGTVQLSRGMIIGADSPNALDLRRHLLTVSTLTAEQRRAMAALPEESFSESAVVEELTSRSLVPREEVERARVARIYSAFREMMAWNSGRFSFDPAVPIVANPATALSAQTIMMQIYQEQDEQSR